MAVTKDRIKRRRACGHKESSGFGAGVSSQPCRFPSARTLRHDPAQPSATSNSRPCTATCAGTPRCAPPAPTTCALPARGGVPGAHGHPLARPAAPLRPLEQRLSPLPPLVPARGLGAPAAGPGRQHRADQVPGAPGLLRRAQPMSRAVGGAGGPAVPRPWGAAGAATAPSCMSWVDARPGACCAPG